MHLQRVVQQLIGLKPTTLLAFATLGTRVIVVELMAFDILPARKESNRASVTSSLTKSQADLKEQGPYYYSKRA
jgi:hypothetical protein